jgi:Rieske Fe-S protein
MARESSAKTSPKKPAAKKAPAKKVVSKKPTPTPTPTPTPSNTKTATPTPSNTKTAIATPRAEAIDEVEIATVTVPTLSALPANALPLTQVTGGSLLISDIPIGATIVGYYWPPSRKLTSLITRLDEKSFVAFKPICPHQGGQVDINGKIILCSRHGMTFNLQNGVNSYANNQRLPIDSVAIIGEKFYQLQP